MRSEGERRKKKKTNKKCMYDYSYTHFQSQKKKKYKKHWNMWLGVERRGQMVKKCGWGSKHVAGGWQMCIIEQINEKKCRKKKKTYIGPK
jgi:hypothetical protein